MNEPILVVDDEKSILELTAMVLRNRGYEVITASDGERGIEMISLHHPPLVLLDYMMPQTDGLSVLRQIRERFPDTYVIMFTGKGSEKVAVELMKTGAADYILKPFSNQDLVERIENVLKIRRFELANRELREERERLLQEIEAWNLELEKRVADKTRELELAHQEILQSEKLAALGHMSAGMAHEIRNPLNSISLFAQVLKSSELAEERETYTRKVLEEVARIDDILVNLLDISKKPRMHSSCIALERVVETVLEQFSAQFHGQGVRLRREFSPGAFQVLADGDEIQHIFSNLFANALQAMPGGGDLVVRLFPLQGDIKVEVADSGCGIDPGNLQKIFDPFFTTKPRGTGFGLSVALRIVNDCGGRIWAESTPGEGTVFHVLLPASSGGSSDVSLQ